MHIIIASYHCVVDVGMYVVLLLCSLNQTLTQSIYQNKNIITHFVFNIPCEYMIFICNKYI